MWGRQLEAQWDEWAGFLEKVGLSGRSGEGRKDGHRASYT